MPQRSEHELKIRENEKLVSLIMAKRNSAEEFNSWISVVLFYKIVHFTEALLADVDEHSSSHSEREEFLKQEVVFPNLQKHDYKSMWQSYSDAKHLCNRSRYYCIYPTCEDIETEKEGVDKYIQLAGRLLPQYIKSGCISKNLR